MGRRRGGTCRVYSSRAVYRGGRAERPPCRGRARFHPSRCGRAALPTQCRPLRSSCRHMCGAPRPCAAPPHGARSSGWRAGTSGAWPWRAGSLRTPLHSCQSEGAVRAGGDRCPGDAGAVPHGSPGFLSAVRRPVNVLSGHTDDFASPACSAGPFGGDDCLVTGLTGSCVKGECGLGVNAPRRPDRRTPLRHACHKSPGCVTHVSCTRVFRHTRSTAPTPPPVGVVDRAQRLMIASAAPGSP